MIAAIIQARMGSTRLPGKVLKKVLGKTLLEHMVERVRRSQRVDKIVIATTNTSQDTPILEECRRIGVDSFAGSEDDVLLRYYEAACSVKADVVVRLTSDCPLIDPIIIEKAIGTFEKSGADYAGNTLHRTYPDGLDVEVFSFATLERTHKHCQNVFDREHVTTYILRHSDQFNLQNVEQEQNLSELRWTVDYDKDFAFVKSVLEALYPTYGAGFGMKEVLELVKQKPEIAALNAGIGQKDNALIQKYNLVQNAALFERAKKRVVNQTQTLSKGWTQFVQGVSPIFLERGQGSHVWDVDGNEKIDYMLGLGAITLGYNYARTNEAIHRQMKKGISFSLPTRLEVELAELLCQLVPSAQMVRFGKNGSDATSCAVKMSRAFSGKPKIAYCGYHGWEDWFAITTSRNRGIPPVLKEHILPFPYNDAKSLQKLLDENPDIGTVIMEPVGVIEPQAGFLDEVKRVTHAHDAVLIFDEVVTGFRVALGGAQAHYKVTPDISALGKGMGNGASIAAIVGSQEIMESTSDIFFSMTFGGEATGLACSIATIQEMQEKKVIEHFWRQGGKLMEGYDRLVRQHGQQEVSRITGVPVHTLVHFTDPQTQKPDLLLKSLFIQEMAKSGMLTNTVHNICYTHSDEDIAKTVAAFDHTLGVIRKARDSGEPRRFLEGTPVKPVFREP